MSVWHTYICYTHYTYIYLLYRVIRFINTVFQQRRNTPFDSVNNFMRPRRFVKIYKKRRNFLLVCIYNSNVCQECVPLYMGRPCIWYIKWKYRKPVFSFYNLTRERHESNENEKAKKKGFSSHLIQRKRTQNIIIKTYFPIFIIQLPSQ